ncbi:hypothetical protein OGATHE_001647 [Ogataea polymorpha]|uniref:Uncharacterized protein n=1 Tax=Ogataea polymorpha TaxID=460523 RepID=A0A9P8PNS6_9ASCO|nr:hypothetical protein OGATHE_001647 [Ogataea polymorpha]
MNDPESVTGEIEVRVNPAARAALVTASILAEADSDSNDGTNVEIEIRPGNSTVLCEVCASMLDTSRLRFLAMASIKSLAFLTLVTRGTA